MRKKKLDNDQIISIANSYANDQDILTISHFANEYAVSPSTISTALHSAISEKLVSERVAKKIAEKAIKQERIRCEQLGIRNSNRLKNFYSKLIYNTWTEKPRPVTIEMLESKLIQAKNQLATFEEVFSDNDEFPLSKDSLENEIASLEDKIRTMKLHI